MHPGTLRAESPAVREIEYASAGPGQDGRVVPVVRPPDISLSSFPGMNYTL